VLLKWFLQVTGMSDRSSYDLGSPLVMFWEGAQHDTEIGRSQSVTASFNGIVRQLRRSGTYSETAS
jgi:hypothetical protein